MTSAQYNGHFPVTYPDHVDAATGRTLTVEPGGIYDVRVAPGRNPGLSPVPGDGRWSIPAEQVPEDPADEEPQEDLLEEPAGDDAPEDPPAAPEPAPAESADDSDDRNHPGRPRGRAASPESEA